MIQMKNCAKVKCPLRDSVKLQVVLESLPQMLHQVHYSLYGSVISLSQFACMSKVQAFFFLKSESMSINP